MVNRDTALTKIFGDPQKRILKRLQKRVNEVNGRTDNYKKMTKKQLREQTDVLKKRLTKKGVTLDTILPDAFAGRPGMVLGTAMKMATKLKPPPEILAVGLATVLLAAVFRPPLYVVVLAMGGMGIGAAWWRATKLRG